MKKNYAILFLVLMSASIAADASWVAKANFAGVARTGAAGFSIGTKGYIGTGLNASFVELNDFWEWNQATNTWTQKANFPGQARYAAVGFSIGTKGYIGTGSTLAAGDFADFWEYDQPTNTWAQKADYGAGMVTWAAAFSIGTKGYIGTGSGNMLGKQFWEWNQATNTWSQKADLPGTARDGATGFSIGTKGYLGTGTTNNGVSMNDFWEWDQATNTWTQKASCISSGRENAVSFAIGTTGVIGTGHDNNSGYSYGTFYSWNQATNTWSSISSSGFGLQEGMCVGFSIGTKGYVGTGYSDIGDPLKEFYELSLPIGIEELEGENAFSIAPNPTTGEFMVSLIEQNAAGKRQVEIYNMAGEKICSDAFNGQTKRVLLASSAGIYFVKVKSEKGERVVKLVKE